MIRIILGLLLAIGGVGAVESSVDALHLTLGIMYVLIGCFLIAWKVEEII